jgi:ligand-binding sensor domain-containing protein
MVMKKRAGCLFFLVLFITARLYAQNNEFQFSKLDITNGLSHNQVNCVFKDSKGFMWFGTLSGLNKYDGYRFKVFKHITGDTTSLNDDFILTISEGPGGKLWIETRNGYNIYDPQTERFSHDAGGFLRSIGIPSQNLTAVKKDRVGNFWFLNSVTGVYKYTALTKITTHIYNKPGDERTIYSNTVSDLSTDSKGNIWLVYNQGVLERVNPATHKVDYRKILAGISPGLSSSYRVFIDNQDDVWAFVPNYSSGVF